MKKTYIIPLLEVLQADDITLLAGSLGRADVPNILFDEAEVPAEGIFAE